MVRSSNLTCLHKTVKSPRSVAQLCMPLADLKEAHTISQRIRTLKKIPPELIPLGKPVPSICGASLLTWNFPLRHYPCVRFHMLERRFGVDSVQSVAVTAGFYSLIRKLWTDKTLRLTRTGSPRSPTHK